MKADKKQSNTAPKAPLRERLCRALDLCPDVAGGESMVEIRGRGRVTVSGCGTILTYRSDCIRLALDRGCLRIEGAGLICTSYFLGAVTVDGRISLVVFEEDGI